MLRLNAAAIKFAEELAKNSNTTNVKVKFCTYPDSRAVVTDSNTTNVKVKFLWH